MGKESGRVAALIRHDPSTLPRVDKIANKIELFLPILEATN
jgi:hypothetical protein